MKTRSFAKINLGIEVLGRRPDKYHVIRTLFQSIDFGDTLELLSRADGEIVLAGTDPAIPWDERNIILKAARLLKREFGIAAGAEIRVDKTDPPGKRFGRREQQRRHGAPRSLQAVGT